METPVEQEKGKIKQAIEKVDWKGLGVAAAKETGRLALNVVAMFGALTLFGAYAKGEGK